VDDDLRRAVFNTDLRKVLTAGYAGRGDESQSERDQFCREPHMYFCNCPPGYQRKVQVIGLEMVVGEEVEEWPVMSPSGGHLYDKGVIEGEPSRTAERVAIRRAAHQFLDRPLIFEDPLALTILSDEARERLRVEAEGESNDPWGRGLRIFLATRSRFAEEELARAFERGVRQYVVLGAGLDTFAYRNPFAQLRVFEVDYPETQAWKRGRLEHGGIAIPDSMRFAPVDFECDTLEHGLEAVGFRRDEPAVFAWLGVVPYLTRDAAFSTLRFVAGLPRGTEVVFDYAIPREMMTEPERRAFDGLAERVARAGEPFRLFFRPDELDAELRAMGFTELENMNGAELRARWLGDEPRQPAPQGGSGRLLSARV
jgi:methyltransferase (TIGR00027 family)